MLVDFNAQEEIVSHGINGGKEDMCAKMYMNSSGKVIVSRIAPNSSIGLYTQKSGNDINFVVSGTGRALRDGVEEILTAGVCHYCPKGSSHMIENTGAEDLVLYTVVQEL